MNYEDSFHGGKHTDEPSHPAVQFWLVLLHLSLFLTIVASFAGFIIGPLLFLYTVGNREAIVYREGTKALNFGITVTIVWILLHIYGIATGRISGMNQYWVGEEYMFLVVSSIIFWTTFRAYWRNPALYPAIPFIRPPKPRMQENQ